MVNDTLHAISMQSPSGSKAGGNNNNTWHSKCGFNTILQEQRPSIPYAISTQPPTNSNNNGNGKGNDKDDGGNGLLHWCNRQAIPE